MSLFYPTNPHFFQPLLPGFYSNFLIPKSFLRQYLKDGDEESDCKLAILRDRTHKIWYVKVGCDGRHLEDGWVKFCTDHHLQIGDFLVFRHHAPYFFDVLIFDPSSCERQLLPSFDDDVDVDDDNDDAAADEDNDNDADDDDDNDDHDDDDYNDDNDDDDHQNSQQSDEKAASSISRLNHHKNLDDEELPKKECAWATSTDYCPHFRTVVRSSHIKSGVIVVPISFAKKYGIAKRRDVYVVVRDELGKSRRVQLGRDGWRIGCRGHYYLCGWPSFYKDYGFKSDDVLCFDLIHTGDIPLLQFCRVQSMGDNDCHLLDQNKIMHASCKSNNSYPFFRKIVNDSNLHRGVTYIPRRFARKTGLAKRWCEMVLQDQKGKSITMKLRSGGSDGNDYIYRWPSFHTAYGLKKGDVVTFKLIHNGVKPIMQFYSPQSKGDNDDDLVQQKAYESFTPDNACPSFRATVNNTNLEGGVTCIPKQFARKNGLTKRWCEMMLQDERGESMTAQLRYSSSSSSTREGNDYIYRWPSFYKAYGLQLGDVLIFQLLHNGDTPLIKFYVCHRLAKDIEERNSTV